MSNPPANAEIRIRQDTTANWATVSGQAWLRPGEPGIEFNGPNKIRLKIGNISGAIPTSSLFKDLPYIGSDLPLFSATDSAVQLKNTDGTVLTVDSSGLTVSGSGVNLFNNNTTINGTTLLNKVLTVTSGGIVAAGQNISGGTLTTTAGATIGNGLTVTAGGATIAGLLTANTGISSTGTISGGGLTVSGTAANLLSVCP